MTINSPALSLLLLVATIGAGYFAAVWNVYVEPDEATRRLFMMGDSIKVKSTRWSALVRLGWLVVALSIAYALGRVQGWIL